MVQIPSSAANWSAASQEIPQISPNPKVLSRTHTSIHHLSLSWASPIQSIYPHPTSCRSILILSTHLRLGLPSGGGLYYRHNNYTVHYINYVIMSCMTNSNAVINNNYGRFQRITLLFRIPLDSRKNFVRNL